MFPPQPDGVMTLGQMKRPWVADVGPNRFRRGLYTYFWRATPHPFLTTFDAPVGVQSCTRRVRSNTPLQALTLLNDPAYFEIAHGLATRILEEPPAQASDRDRLEYALQICLGRKGSDQEMKTLQAMLEQERAELANSSEASRPQRKDRGQSPLLHANRDVRACRSRLRPAIRAISTGFPSLASC